MSLVYAATGAVLKPMPLPMKPQAVAEVLLLMEQKFKTVDFQLQKLDRPTPGTLLLCLANPQVPFNQDGYIWQDTDKVKREPILPGRVRDFDAVLTGC
jgi:hypothetical protein